MILQAPLIFTVACLVVSAMAYAALKWVFSSILEQNNAKIATLEERIKLRDDQLANKLNAMSPDEARAIIQKLEERLEKISSRKIPEGSRAILVEKLKLPHGVAYEVNIAYDMACADGNQFATEFLTLFSGVGGWTVNSNMLLGISSPPPTGIAIRTRDPKKLSADEQIIFDAFSAAGIAFDLQGWRPKRDGVQVLITAKTK